MACATLMVDGHFCGRPVYEEAACIFHSRQTDKDAQLFAKELEQLLLEHDDLDCSAFVIPGQVSGFQDRVFPGKVSFRQAVFLGAGLFSGARFLGHADFSGAQMGQGDFSEALFDRPTVWAKTRFQGDVRFTGARFHDTVTWRGAQFGGSAVFTRMGIRGRADFSRTRFESKALFTEARFKDGVNFSGALFLGTTDFTRARFADEVYFSETQFPTEDEGTGEPTIEMSAVSFERPEKVHFYRINAGRLSFLKTNLYRVDFTEVTWMHRKNGRAALWDEVRSVGCKDYRELARLYRQIRFNYEGEGERHLAADFRYGEMEMRRRQVTAHNPAGRLFYQNCSLLSLYKVVSDYGENVARPFMWLGIVWFVCGLLIYGFGLLEFSQDSLGQSPGLAQALQVSLAALTLQSHGLVEPAGMWGRWLMLAEGIIGPILILISAVTVVRSLR